MFNTKNDANANNDFLFINTSNSQSILPGAYFFVNFEMKRCLPSVCLEPMGKLLSYVVM